MSEKNKEKDETGKSGDNEVYFKCRLCEAQKPLTEMRTVTRFSPLLIVCKDCARALS